VQFLFDVLLLEAMIGGGYTLRMMADNRHDAGLQTGIPVRRRHRLLLESSGRSVDETGRSWQDNGFGSNGHGRRCVPKNLLIQR